MEAHGSSLGSVERTFWEGTASFGPLRATWRGKAAAAGGVGRVGHGQKLRTAGRGTTACSGDSPQLGTRSPLRRGHAPFLQCPGSARGAAPPAEPGMVRSRFQQAFRWSIKTWSRSCRKRLALASAHKALDPCSSTHSTSSRTPTVRDTLAWLPRELPAHVKLVLSTLPGGSLEALRGKLPQAQRLEIEPMPAAEGDRLLQEWLRSIRRKLQPEQRAEVLRGFGRCGLPLYLRLAFEEARRWRSYDGAHELGSDVPGPPQPVR